MRVVVEGIGLQVSSGGHDDGQEGRAVLGLCAIVTVPGLELGFDLRSSTRRGGGVGPAWKVGL